MEDSQGKIFKRAVISSENSELDFQGSRVVLWLGSLFRTEASTFIPPKLRLVNRSNDIYIPGSGPWSAGLRFIEGRIKNSTSALCAMVPGKLFVLEAGCILKYEAGL